VQDAPAWLTRLTAWLEVFEPAFGHRAQRVGLRRYVEGVLSDSRRKSMEAMWARLRDPGSYQGCSTSSRSVFERYNVVSDGDLREVRDDLGTLALFPTQPFRTNRKILREIS